MRDWILATQHRTANDLCQSDQEPTPRLPLPPLPPRQSPRVHTQSPSHGLLAQPEVPPDPGQTLPGRPARVERRVAEEFDDLWPVGEGRIGLSALPKINATLCRPDSLPHLLLEESQLKPPFPEVVRGRP
jgi:hypothetical protein